MSRQPRLPLLAVLAGCLCGLAAGCGGSAADQDKKGAAEKKTVRDQKPPLAVAADLLRGTANIDRCKEAVRLANSHLNDNPGERAKLPEAQPDPGLLRDRFHLTDGEVEYVTRATFQTADAYHLDLCYRLRDTAEALHLPEFAPADRAAKGFAWATRLVHLGREDAQLLPPQFVLRRGWGTAEERGLVFVAMLHQLGIPGCLVAVPAEGGQKFVWAGALVSGDDGDDILLFDLRLGAPVPGPGGEGVATLAQVQASPELLQGLSAGKDHPYGVTAEQAAKAQVHLAVPLTALSGRMGYLEEKLNRTDRVRLAVPAGEWLGRFGKAAGGEAAVWNPPAERGKPVPNSPTRCLLMFLPPEEGGEADPATYQGFQSELFPADAIIARYRQLNLWEELPEGPRNQLLGINQRLWSNYILNPRDQLTRGRYEDMTRPVVRIRTVFNELAHAPVGEAKLAKDIAAWRDEIRDRFVAAQRGEPGAEAALQAVWGRDQFLLQLALPGQEDQEVRKDLPKTALTFVVLEGLAESINNETLYLLAGCWREKAAEADYQLAAARRQGRAVPSRFREQAAEAWREAVDGARQYTSRYPLSAAAVGSRLDQMERQWAQRPLDPAPWNRFFAELHQSASVHLGYAAYLRESGDGDQAREVAAGLASDLHALRTDDRLRGLIKTFLQRAEPLPPPLRAALERQMKTFRDTLDPGGSLEAMEHLAAYQAR